MQIKLFELSNKQIIPTEHCYAMGTLKRIMDEYPDNYLKIYKYLFYMNCPNPDMNPFFNVAEDDKQDIILKEVDADFDPDEEPIVEANKFCNTLYETPTARTYRAIKTMLDRLDTYLLNTTISHGRDGNLTTLLQTAAKFHDIRESFKGVYKDLKEEQDHNVRGGADLAYDQRS